MAMVWGLDDITPTEKLLLLAFADHANDEDFLCWPSLNHLSKKTGLHKATVCRLIEKFIQKGLVQKVGKKGLANLYKLTVHKRGPQLVAQND